MESYPMHHRDAYCKLSPTSGMNGSCYEVAYCHDEPSEKDMIKSEAQHRRGGGFLVVIVACMIVMAVCNLMVTIMLVDVIRRMPPSPTGPIPLQNQDYLSDDQIWPAAASSDVDDVTRWENVNVKEVSAEDDVKISAENEIHVVAGRKGTKMSMTKTGALEFTSDTGIRSPGPAGQNLLYAEEYLDARLLANVSKLQVDGLFAPRIVNENLGLRVQSRQSVAVQGMQGVEVVGGKIVFNSEQDLIFKSRGTDLVLTAREGVFLDRVRDMPTVQKRSLEEPSVRALALCVCGSNGRVFAVPLKEIGFSCANANEKINPCMLPSY